MKAAIAQVSANAFSTAQPDPVAPFSAPIAAHMNDDHAAAMLAITRHYVPLDTPIDAARLLAIDRLGMEVECACVDGVFTCRVPFLRCDPLSTCPCSHARTVGIIHLSKHNSNVKL